MNAVTDKQTALIHRLAGERMQALTGSFAHLLQAEVVTTRDASRLIDALMAVPRDPVAVDPAQQARIDALKANVPNLSPRDAGFALSLIGQYESKGALSERQWPHVDRLAAPAAEATCDPQVGDIIDVGGDYVLVVAGKSGRPYGKVLGPRGWRYEAGAMDRARQGEVLTGEALAAVAAAHGHAHGWCIFCSLELTDERSVTAGYGPTCASKRGLPWG